jgi:hypothetical protein
MVPFLFHISRLKEMKFALNKKFLEGGNMVDITSKSSFSHIPFPPVSIDFMPYDVGIKRPKPMMAIGNHVRQLNIWPLFKALRMKAFF